MYLVQSTGFRCIQDSRPALVCAGLAICAAVAQTQDHQYSTIDIQAGYKLYATQCALCHGGNGDGIAGVNLARQQTIALDPKTGKRVWTFPQYDVTDAGMLTPASDLLFTGGREGYFYALDAKTGKELWKANLGGSIVMAPITYQIDGKQYVSVISGNSLVTFSLHN